jgi:di/tricarboxylate transporter
MKLWGLGSQRNIILLEMLKHSSIAKLQNMKQALCCCFVLIINTIVFIFIFSLHRVQDLLPF